MRTIHCPKDIGLNNTFEGRGCECEQYYNNCYHCWTSAIAENNQRYCERKLAEQEQKTGYWTIKQYQVPIENKQVPTISDITFPSIEPTACKTIYTYAHSACKSEEYLNKHNYCPNCGAKMSEIPTGSESEGEK